MHLYGKKHLKILFSKTEDALWLNLCIYYWEHLHVCSGNVTQVSEPWPVGLLFFVVVFLFCTFSVSSNGLCYSSLFFHPLNKYQIIISCNLLVGIISLFKMRSILLLSGYAVLAVFLLFLFFLFFFFCFFFISVGFKYKFSQNKYSFYPASLYFNHV